MADIKKKEDLREEEFIPEYDMMQEGYKYIKREERRIVVRPSEDVLGNRIETTAIYKRKNAETRKIVNPPCKGDNNISAE